MKISTETCSRFAFAGAFLAAFGLLHPSIAQAGAPFANGSDPSWITQMEASGIPFFNASGVQEDGLEVLQGVGINAVRLRVWVNPAGGWCDQADVVAKAVRAKNLGLRVLIDFHYSDTWADPGHQTKPAAWANDGINQLKIDVTNHTTAVLTALQAAGVTPEWVQVGNEVDNGMLWPDGEASTNMANFAALVTSGYTAVKSVFPSALVIVHVSNGFDDTLFRYVFDGLFKYGAQYDMIGMSLYPTSANWATLNTECLATMNDVVATYGRPVMVVEVGMDVNAASACESFIADLITKVKSVSGGNGMGVFYWEPESYNSWQGYTMGAFGTNGAPTVAMNAFLDSEVTPSFVSQPASQTVASGGTVVFTAPAAASAAAAYQWDLNGLAIPGAAGSTLVISGATPAQAGSYTCVATNAMASATSAAAMLTVVDATDASRLANLSCRALVGTGGNVIITGFVIGGSGTSGTEPVLVRGSGPALGLAPFNLPGVLPDPELTLTNVSANPNAVVTTDAGWAGASSISGAAAALGAFSWGTSPTADSAALETLPAGNYTAEVAGAGKDSGVALVEVYDATPAGTATLVSPRLINLSARVQVGTGANVVFAGFVIAGSSAKTVLVRCSGPALSLAPFNLPGTLPDPQLTLTNVTTSPSTVVTSNTGWGGDPEINTVANSVGAFPWSLTSKDSAILITLPPGNYTAGVQGASGDTGVALIEIYEVP